MEDSPPRALCACARGCRGSPTGRSPKPAKFLAGFNLIEADSMEAAMAIVQQFRGRAFGSIEVRLARHDMSAVRMRSARLPDPGLYRWRHRLTACKALPAPDSRMRLRVALRFACSRRWHRVCPAGPRQCGAPLLTPATRPRRSASAKPTPPAAIAAGYRRPRRTPTVSWTRRDACGGRTLRAATPA